MRKLVFVESRGKENTALNKAPEDVLRVAESLGFKGFLVRAFVPRRSNIVCKVFARCRWGFEEHRITSSVSSGDVILLQSPPEFLCRVAGRRLLQRLISRGVRFIYFIHDIGELREGENSRGLSRMLTDITLSVSDVIIAHNERMKEWLVAHGIAANKIEVLGIFDYLMQSFGKNKVIHGLPQIPSVIIAGNLGPNKSPYVYQLENVAGVSWKLYGPYFENDKVCSCVKYCGCYAPEELPKELNGDFGLVWDGDSVDTCAGVTGEYLRYNNPHKLSLYLVCGIPVIIWSQSAEAEFVIRMGVGIAVDSLRDIPKAVTALGHSGYMELLCNCKRLANDLRTGVNSRKALTAALEKIGVV